MRFRLTVEYDGTDFAGWQLQASDRTVQLVLESAIRDVTGRGSRVLGAGRTDAGVHARGQVCHFDSESGLGPREMQRALNAVLPGDVAVLEVRIAPAGFDARRDAIRKRYLYRVLHREAPSPLRSRFTWHVRPELDVAEMRRAAGLLDGEHDFSALRGAPGGRPPGQSTVRTLDVVEVLEQGDEIRVGVEGRSFLRHMVRNLVGTLVEVGRGKRDAAGIPELLEARDRARAGPTAPAHGLCLEAIRYEGESP